MKSIDRTTWRVAETIREQLTSLRHERLGEGQPLTSRLAEITQRLGTLRQRMIRAHRRGLEAAELRLRGRLQRALEEMSHESGQALRQLERAQVLPIPSLRELVGELQQLTLEFGGWTTNRRASQLGAITEPIELRGIELGRFEIVLDLEALPRLDRRTPYEVIALDPNPAAGSPSVTHPHVSDQQLCEGEAHQPIRRALSSGRICEFFILVRAVLHQYNDDSPYVRLAEWEGEPCTDCGYRASEEYTDRCEDCSSLVCFECISACSACERDVCYRCLAACEQCDELVCLRCTERCQHCQAIICSGCVSDSLCETCETKSQKEANDEPESKIQSTQQGSTQNTQRPAPSTETSACRRDGGPTNQSQAQPAGTPTAAVHPHGVGQAPVATRSR
jgi:hypothetical protein